MFYQKEKVADLDIQEINNMEKQSILITADSLVNGVRQTDYNDPVQNFNDIAQLASLLTQKNLTAEDCCLVLISLKLIRERFKHKEDNLIDLAGYTEILNRIKNEKE